MFHLICETTRPRTFLVGARCTRRKTLRRSIVPTGCVEDEILWSPMEIPQRGCDVFIFHPFSYQHRIVFIQNFYLAPFRRSNLFALLFNPCGQM